MVKDFISHCLDKDPASRFTVDQLLNHPWITDMEIPQVALSEQAHHKVGTQIIEIKKANHFQRSIVSFLANQKNSPKDKAYLSELFKRVDKDNNGYLTMDEVE